MHGVIKFDEFYFFEESHKTFVRYLIFMKNKKN